MMRERSGDGTQDRLRKGDRIPAIALKACMCDALNLRPTRGARVFVTMHRPDCDECVRCVREIASLREAVASWGADILVVSAEAIEPQDMALRQLGVPVLEDPARAMADGRLTVIITDQWGEAWFAGDGKGLHDCISSDEVVEWVKFIAIQCPECEGPEGEWRNL